MLSRILRGSVVLCDGTIAGSLLEKYSLNGEGMIGPVNRLRADAVQIYARGNFKTDLEVTIWTLHDDMDAARRFRDEQAQTVFGKADFTHVFDTLDGGVYAATLSGAGWRGARPELMGCSTRTVYGIVGGRFTIEQTGSGVDPDDVYDFSQRDTPEMMLMGALTAGERATADLYDFSRS